MQNEQYESRGDPDSYSSYNDYNGTSKIIFNIKYIGLRLRGGSDSPSAENARYPHVFIKQSTGPTNSQFIPIDQFFQTQSNHIESIENGRQRSKHVHSPILQEIVEEFRKSITIPISKPSTNEGHSREASARSTMPFDIDHKSLVNDLKINQEVVNAVSVSSSTEGQTTNAGSTTLQISNSNGIRPSILRVSQIVPTSQKKNSRTENVKPEKSTNLKLKRLANRSPVKESSHAMTPKLKSFNKAKSSAAKLENKAETSKSFVPNAPPSIFIAPKCITTPLQINCKANDIRAVAAIQNTSKDEPARSTRATQTCKIINIVEGSRFGMATFKAKSELSNKIEISRRGLVESILSVMFPATINRKCKEIYANFGKTDPQLSGIISFLLIIFSIIFLLKTLFYKCYNIIFM